MQLPGVHATVDILDLDDFDGIAVYFEIGLANIHIAVTTLFFVDFVVMDRFDVVYFVGHRIDPLVFVTAHILLNGFADSPINQL